MAPSETATATAPETAPPYRIGTPTRIVSGAGRLVTVSSCAMTSSARAGGAGATTDVLTSISGRPSIMRNTVIDRRSGAAFMKERSTGTSVYADTGSGR